MSNLMTTEHDIFSGISDHDEDQRSNVSSVQSQILYARDQDSALNFSQSRTVRIPSSSSSEAYAQDDAYSRLLSTSFWQLPAQTVELPWEQKGSIFSNPTSVNFLSRFKRTAYGSLNALTAPEVASGYDKLDNQVYTRAVRKLRDYEWKAMESANEVRAIGRWRNIIEYNFKASTLGEQLIHMMDDDAT
jgi:hypothetical protein